MTDKPDLRAVLEHYGEHTGKRMVLCPLGHENGTPSCSVNYSKGVWHCHSCGEGGDAWTLIMKKEGIPKHEFGRAKDFAAAHGFADGGAGGGGQQVRGSAYGGRRTVPRKAGNRPSGGQYKPSWRRG